MTTQREREKEYAVDDECKTRERMGVTSEREIQSVGGRGGVGACEDRTVTVNSL